MYIMMTSYRVIFPVRRVMTGTRRVAGTTTAAGASAGAGARTGAGAHTGAGASAAAGAGAPRAFFLGGDFIPVKFSLLLCRVKSMVISYLY